MSSDPKPCRGKDCSSDCSIDTLAESHLISTKQTVASVIGGSKLVSCAAGAILNSAPDNVAGGRVS